MYIFSFHWMFMLPGAPYVDQNAPYFGQALRGGLIGDFLTHIAYLAYIFTGPVIDLRTIWLKRMPASAWPADEFRGFIKGERATATVAFSGNAQPDGFWIRVVGTKMQAEANLFEPPRLTVRQARAGEPALREASRWNYGGQRCIDRYRGGILEETRWCWQIRRIARVNRCDLSRY